MVDEAPSDRIKHLEFIQTTIARMASNSFVIRGWSLTVATAIFAYVIEHLRWEITLLPLLPAIAFAWLDVYYLRQERLFRQLYSDVARTDVHIPPFDMNTVRYNAGKKYPRCTYWRVWRSGTILVLHGGIFLVALGLLGVAIFQELSAAEVTQCVRNALQD